MKRVILSYFLFASYSLVYSQPCNPQAMETIENALIKSYCSNVGDLWGTLDLSDPGFEYPKRSIQDINNGVNPKSPVFAGGVWMSAKDEFNNLRVSALRYRTRRDLGFSPGPIRLSTGRTDDISCTYFDRVWKVLAYDVNNHIQKYKDNSLPITNMPQSIQDWPAKGNKNFTTVPIEDDLAPFVDVNGNDIYDPENGDYPKIKGDEARFVVFNDLGNGRYVSTTNKPIGVEVHMMTFLFYTAPFKTGLETTLFHDLRVIKKTDGDAKDFIFGLYVDSDIGNFNDDYVGCDTPNNVGYSYNADNFDENAGNGDGYKNNPPVLFTKFLNRKMGTFSYFINSTTSPLKDPNTAEEYRNVMEGKSGGGVPYTVSADAISSGSPITKFCFYGNPAKSSEWSMASQSFTSRDLRYSMSTTPMTLSYNQAEDFNFMLYIHNYVNYTYPPDINGEAIPELNFASKFYTDSIDNCNISIEAKITPDTNGMKTGKIEITSIKNTTGNTHIKWSTDETSQTIDTKDSGSYRVFIIDGKNCYKDSTFFIPKVGQGTSSVINNNLNTIRLYPNPVIDKLIVFNPFDIQIDRVSIYNVAGRKVKEYGFLASKNFNELDVTSLPKANYILKVYSKDKVRSFQISK